MVIYMFLLFKFFKDTQKKKKKKKKKKKILNLKIYYDAKELRII